MRASVMLSLVSLSALASCAGGCCDESFRMGLRVTVVSMTGVPICDATVRATIDEYSEVLRPSGGQDCAYSGLGERAGHFVATATAAGYRPNSVSGDIDEDSCHVITQTVEIQLAPN